MKMPQRKYNSMVGLPGVKTSNKPPRFLTKSLKVIETTGKPDERKYSTALGRPKESTID